MSQSIIFVDHLSQPCRTVMIFCRLNSLSDVKEQLVNISKGATRTPQYLGMNPLGKVPYYQEPDGFGVTESTAILRYMCNTRKESIPDHWYPSNPRLHAKVDSVVDWHGSTLRIGSMNIVWNRVLTITKGVQGNEAVVEGFGLPTLKAALGTIHKVWLKDTPFVAGTEISIADLLLACEVEQLKLLDCAALGPKFDELMKRYPSIPPWLERVKVECSPHYENVHAMLSKMRDRLVSIKEQNSKM